MKVGLGKNGGKWVGASVLAWISMVFVHFLGNEGGFLAALIAGVIYGIGMSPIFIILLFVWAKIFGIRDDANLKTVIDNTNNKPSK